MHRRGFSPIYAAPDTGSVVIVIHVLNGLGIVNGGSLTIVCSDVLSGGFNNILSLCKRTAPIQALIPTAVHSRGTPAQPAYPTVRVERLWCLFSMEVASYGSP